MLKNMTIKRKLLLYCIICLIAMLVVGLVGFGGIKRQASIQSVITKNYTTSQINMGILLDDIDYIGAAYLTLLVGRDDSKIESTFEYTDGIWVEVDELIAAFEALSGMENQDSILAELKSNVDSFKSVSTNMQSAITARNYGLAMTFYQEFDDLRIATGDSANALVKSLKEDASGVRAQRDKTSAFMSTMIFVIIVIAAIIQIAFNLVIASGIKKGLNKAIDVADELAQGKVDVDIDRASLPRDEVGHLLSSFADTIDSLKDQANKLEQIADGNIDIDINARSDEDVLNVSMKKVQGTLKNLVHDINGLAEHFKEGDTKYRNDPNKFKGEYKNIIEGTNGVTDIIMEQVDYLAGAIMMLGAGELPAIENDKPGDFAIIIDQLEQTVNSISDLVTDTEAMANAALAENYGVRADVEKYKGKFRNVIDGINKTLDMVVDKTNWYVSIIDAVPISIQAMDVNGNWTLVNDRFANVLKAEGVITSKEDAVGKPCRMGDIEVNGITKLKNGQDTYTFDNKDSVMQQSTAELRDVDGKVIGYVGAIQNLSSIIKVADYTDKAVERLQYNLSNLAKGVFQFRDNDIESNEYTKEVEAKFATIDEALNQVTSSVGALVSDSIKLADAAVEGQLDTRADLSLYSGEYAKVMKGLNDTMDAMVAPVNATVEILEEVARGRLDREVEGNFRGDHTKSKEALNSTIRQLRSIISEISTLLTAIGNGDLTVKTGENYNGDFVAIKEAINGIIINMTDVMGKIKIASEQVANGSRQLSEGAQTLADGSTKQASAVQELSATTGHVAEQAMQNTEYANEANSLTKEVMAMAEHGNSQMKGMLSSMDEINESSANISKIIKVIDDIAFQTNILALNAAVEAARAGVHGKGFAVVADEVRNLAAKSAQAASETTTLIEGSISKVEAGTQIANNTADALVKIVEGISNAANICEKIAEVSESQKSGVAEVNNGIGEVNLVVQSNSATSEESAASAEELYSQADELNKLVARFKFNGSGSSGSTAASPKASKAAIPAPKAHEEPPMITLDDFDMASDKY